MFVLSHTRSIYDLFSPFFGTQNGLSSVLRFGAMCSSRLAILDDLTLEFT